MVQLRNIKQAPKSNSLGSLIRMARIHRDLTQAQLAQKVGISAKAVSLVECGHRGISSATFSRVLEVLGFEMVIKPIEEETGQTGAAKILQKILPELKNLITDIEGLPAMPPCPKDDK